MRYRYFYCRDCICGSKNRWMVSLLKANAYIMCFSDECVKARGMNLINTTTLQRKVERDTQVDKDRQRKTETEREGGRRYIYIYIYI